MAYFDIINVNGLNMRDCDDIAMYDYMVAHWNEYKFCGSPIVDSKEDFIELLNYIQAGDETLESLHDVCFNGGEDFTGIYGDWTNMCDALSILREFNGFYKSFDDLFAFLTDFYDEWFEEGFSFDIDPNLTPYQDTMLNGFIDCDAIVFKTRDGYVLRVSY